MVEEKKCTLGDHELIEKCEELIHKLAETGDKSWCLRVPPDFNKDPDMVFGELINRFKYAEKEVIKCLEQIGEIKLLLGIK